MDSDQLPLSPNDQRYIQQLRKEYDAVIYGMLGNRTVHQFALLTLAQRQTIFRRHLVQSTPVHVVDDDDDDLNPAIADGLLLRQEFHMGSDEVGKGLVREARELYYGENSFVVTLDWLCEFKTDYLGDSDTPVSVGPLVKNGITVILTLSGDHHSCHSKPADTCDGVGVEDPKSVHYRHGLRKDARWVQERLKDLFLFTNAKQITLDLQGGGVLDGSDLITHQTLHDIAYVVKLLINSFGDRFDIRKTVRRTRPVTSKSLLSYWLPPTADARRSVKLGWASFADLMQVEMEDWTWVFPDVIQEYTSYPDLL